MRPNLELRSAELWRCVEGGQGVGWGEQRAENFRKVGDLGSVSDREDESVYGQACMFSVHLVIMALLWSVLGT